MDPNRQGGYGYPVNQSSSGGRIHDHYEFAPMAAPMPGHPGYHDYPASGTFFPGPVYQYQPRANQYQPHPGSGTFFPGPVYNHRLPFYDQQPGSSTGYNNRAREPLYAHPGADTDLFGRGGNPNNNPYYPFSRLIEPPPTANQGPRGLGPVARPSAQLVRANRLERLVDLARTRSTGHLEAIVHELESDQRRNGVRLMELASLSYGERALQELVWLVARNLGHQALRRLFWCLIEGWIMEQSNGPDLLQLFFTTSDYGADLSAIFMGEVAIPRFWDLITTRIGSTSIMRCLDNAGYTAQGATLRSAIVTHTVQIAMNASGSDFLQALLQRGSYHVPFKEGIRERVEGSLAELSMDPCGSNVVRMCFVPTQRPPWVPLLQHGIRAFSQLRPEWLPHLVRNRDAGRVLSDLLLTSLERDVATEEATTLAVRILEAVPPVAQTGTAFRRPARDLRQRAVELIGSYNLPAR